MSDVQFCDWWDARVEKVQANAESEDEVEAACNARDDAFADRWAA